MVVLALCLSFLAPIPKAGTYIGHIAVLLSQPEPTILLLKPDGQEVKRVKLKNVKGQLNDIRLSREGKVAIISTNDQKDGNRYYLIPLLVNDPEKLIYETKSSTWTMCISKDSGTAFFSEKQDEPDARVKHFSLNLKTGTKSEFDLGGKHSIVEISQDDDDLFLSLHKTEDGTSHKFCLVSRKTKEITFIFEERNCWPALFANAKKSILFFTNQNPANRQMRHDIKVLDLSTRQKMDVPRPDDDGSYTGIRSAGADNEHVAFGWQVKNESQIVVSHVKNKTTKVLYTLKPGEVLVDFDWR